MEQMNADADALSLSAKIIANSKMRIKYLISIIRIWTDSKTNDGAKNQKRNGATVISRQ